MRRGNPWVVLVTLCLGFFMTLLDLTIVNVAMPSMLETLHATLDDILWVVSGYTIALAVLLITAGRLGDMWGRRNMFAAGVALFTLASVACGLAPSAEWLIAARVVQGAGAAVLMPQTMAIIVATFPAERRGAALGVWGAVAGLATIAGPTVGGALVSWAGWRWIFYLNVPVGLVVLVMALTLVPDVRHGGRQRLDLPGVLLASAGLVAVTFALVEGERYDWGRIWSFVSVPLLGVAGLALLGAFVWHQARRQDKQPLVPFSLFRDRNFALMNGVGVIMSVGLIGGMLPLTIYLQSVLGHTALQAGLIMAPMAVVNMLLSPLVGRLSDQVGGKFILMGGLALYGGGLAWTVLVADVGTAWPALLPGLVVAGAGMAGMFIPLQALAMYHVPPPLAGAASGLVNTTRQLGSALGAAVVGALMQNRLAASIAHEAATRAPALPASARGEFRDALAALSAGARPVAGLPGDVARTARDVFVHGFTGSLVPTMALPVGAMLAAAALCFAVQGKERPRQPTPAPATPARSR
ncbi:DHA2 family efflux MFS transporter permease subunit [Bailinhaonella thermotolerans]|uniref:DHA2 family efflux MFS transporter permease subunit n=1 Tax=Bailinhaonella thermotolerans TaxID=1070861 RepID=A0A3A4BVM8_9ACTN|nr:DHA2 family efflux MFS transporter permease subunit [Bailinhaonella thermotolerans]RJL35658.1 DHA2 family efflux MFS transporter permease subunit [Bailinhaonella thermotolerans]